MLILESVLKEKKRIRINAMSVTVVSMLLRKVLYAYLVLIMLNVLEVCRSQSIKVIGEILFNEKRS